MPDNTFQIRFVDCTPDEANVLAEELANDLREVDPSVDVQRRKESSTTQDFGSILVLVLQTTAATVVAGGVAAFLKRWGAKIVISKDGHVVAENIDGRTVERVAQAFKS